VFRASEIFPFAFSDSPIWAWRILTVSWWFMRSDSHLASLLAISSFSRVSSTLRRHSASFDWVARLLSKFSPKVYMVDIEVTIRKERNHSAIWSIPDEWVHTFIFCQITSFLPWRSSRTLAARISESGDQTPSPLPAPPTPVYGQPLGDPHLQQMIPPCWYPPKDQQLAVQQQWWLVPLSENPPALQLLGVHE
jgi:hypothetical protein